MEDRVTKRVNPILWITGSLTGIFLLWRVTAMIKDLIDTATDEQYRAMKTAHELTLTQQIPVRESLLTIALGTILMGLAVGALVGIYIGLRWFWHRANLVYPNLHGLPATWENKPRLTVTAQPAGYLSAGQGDTLLPDFPAVVSPYDLPLSAKALPIGVRRDGQQITTPLIGVGNTLIAGNSGGGKTELVASLLVIAARLWREGQTPVEVTLIDGKGDFSGLARPRLMPYPITHEPKEALQLLRQIVADSDHRQIEFDRAKVRSIDHAWELGMRAPVNLIVVDELSYYTQQQNKTYREQFEKLLEELAARGRSRGARLMLTTQYATKEVITRRVTGISHDRIAFRTADGTASRVILDENGAEALATIPGRFLYKGASVIAGQGLYADLRMRFPAFLQTLAQGSTPQLPVTIQPPALPEPGSSTVSNGLDTGNKTPEIETPPGVAMEASSNSIEPKGDGPVFPRERPPFSPWELGVVYRTVLECGGVKPAQTKLYGDPNPGGKHWYWLRTANARACKARGLPFDPEQLELPEKYR